MPIKIIVGANYGDEGKGFVTDYFAQQARKEGYSKGLVVMSNGGPQRGHTVIHNNNRHIFHHLSSGSLQGFDTYFPKTFLINPAVFAQEHFEFFNKENIKVYTNPSCKITSPYNMHLNQIKATHNNTCGMGIWETLKKYENHKDFPKWAKFHMEIENRQRSHLYFERLNFISEASNLNLPILSKDMMEKIELRFFDDCHYMKEKSIIINDSIISCYDYVIFENGQGLGLDDKIQGEELFTTPSNTDILNAVQMIESHFNNQDIEIIYVTRPYLTRHGIGPMDDEDPNMFFEDKTNVPNSFQGSLRFGHIIFHKMMERIKRSNQYIPAITSNDYKYSLAVTHSSKHDCSIFKHVEKFFNNVYYL